ncbi:MAG: hypothetical protein IPL22_18960 [Bacteroidetes bacterium]|nr:hypothetical protein [Bacteroidota bacterium]
MVTDRDQLDRQIYRNFLNMGAVKEKKKKCDQDSEQLRDYLVATNAMCFLLFTSSVIQGKISGAIRPERNNCLVDEAHRTQSKTWQRTCE